MRRIGVLVAIAALALCGCGGTSGDRNQAKRPAAERDRDADRGADRDRGPDARSRVEAGDPDRGHEGQGHNPNAEAQENRAYPKQFVTADQALGARKAYEALPTKLAASSFRRGTQNVTARAAVGADWKFIGPDVGTAPGPTTESLKDSITSGRITSMAIDPNCGATSCRMWIAAAGGGVWRTTDALAATPTWTAVDNGLPTDNLGSLQVDPNDATGNTIYAGTGEANAINEAGLGLYKSTDGGDHWALVPGSDAVAKNRSIGVIRIPKQANNQTIWIGTALGRNGQASTNGGSVEPPGVAPLGVYESTDGGATFTKQFSQPQNSYIGGVTDLELDPSDPSTVYASLFGYGVWRSVAGGGWEQVFVPENKEGDDRAEIALAKLGNGKTRAYVMDGGSTDDGDLTGDLFRADDMSQPAATLVGAGNDNGGWTKLSSDTNGDPGFAVYQPCQAQCDYDMFLEVDPSDPDTVWEGGSMVYEEIRPLQDSSLAGVASNRSNGRAVMRSTDAGQDWTDMTADTQTPRYEQMHPDQHALVFDPANPKIAIVGSDGGVVRTDGSYDDISSQCATRDGVSADPDDVTDCQQWLSEVPHRLVNMNSGLATLQFVDLAVDPRDPNGDLMGGTQDNGTFAFSKFGTATDRSWFESVNGDGAAAGFDAKDPNVRVHTFFLGLFDVNHHGADPNYWTFIAQPIQDSGERSSFYTAMRTDPVVGGTIYAGAQHIWRTTDDGGPQAYLEKYCLGPGGVPQYDPSKTKCGDFEALGPDLTDPALGDRTDGADYVVRVERATSDENTLWVGGRRGRLFVSKNANAPGARNVKFDRIDSGQSPGRFPSGIAIDPTDANHAYVSYSGYAANTPSTPGHVYDVHYDPSSQAATFKDISYDLADQPITALVLDSYTGDLYGGTDTGVVRLPAGATAWEKAAGSLPAATTPGLNLQASGRVLYAATYGRSVYKLELAPGARISSADSVPEGSTIVLDGAQSAAFGGAKLSYAWTFPDGTTATGQSVSWTAAGQGDARNVTLTVTAPDGRTGTTTKALKVTAPTSTGGGGGTGGGGTGGGGTGGGGTTTTPPTGNLALTTKSYRLAGSHLKLGLSCPKTQTLGCAGKLTVTVRLGSKTITLGSASFAIPANIKRSASISISKTTRAKLGKRKSIRATARITQLNVGGKSTILKLAFTLKH